MVKATEMLWAPRHLSLVCTFSRVGVYTARKLAVSTDHVFTYLICAARESANEAFVVGADSRAAFWADAIFYLL